MKIAILVLLAVCVSAAVGFYTDGDAGQPLCNKPEEHKRPWRNNFDPTRYWVCLAANVPGSEVECPIGTGFIDTDKVFGCVNWESWVWTVPHNPPSKQLPE